MSEGKGMQAMWGQHCCSKITSNWLDCQGVHTVPRPGIHSCAHCLVAEGRGEHGRGKAGGGMWAGSGLGLQAPGAVSSHALNSQPLSLAPLRILGQDLRQKLHQGSEYSLLFLSLSFPCFWASDSRLLGSTDLQPKDF